jgi:hypothetical protein
MNNNIFLIISLSILLRMKNVSDKSCREKRNTHFLFNNVHPIPPKNHAIYAMWKNDAVGQSTDDNMVHAHGWLDNCGYQNMLIICNVYCFSTATIVARICLSETLRVQ